MIIDKYIKTKVNGRMVKRYKELGYNVKQNDVIDLPIEYLSEYSHKIIRCSCDICGEEKDIKYNNYCAYIKRDINNRYTCKNCNSEKRKNTCKEKYGIDNVSKLESIKHKKKETMEKNGLNYFMCEDGFKEKILEIYGVENVSYSEELKEKKIQTCLKNYGVENPSQSPEIYEKKKQTCFKNYGVENPSYSEELKEKKIQTCLKNYGVENPSQSFEIHKKQQSGYIKKYYNSDLYYRGSYEKDFIEYCLYNNIEIENYKGYINYVYDNKNRKYFPDFFIKETNTVVEIKSTYTMNYDYDVNIAKKEATLKSGFSFVFIVDKYYDEFNLHLNQKNRLL